jgi:FkbM family methyltransferase
MAMEFVTYAQNFEDLMLFRALKGVKRGFYIDLGAAEPELHSVTKAFYDLGWSGINVEPAARPYKKLLGSRIRDININTGIWSEKGQRTIYLVGAENELSTTNAWLMEQHRAAGWAIREETIQVTSLADICSEYVQNQEIHFLTVDVEGAEVEAFEGHDFQRWRPWILVVESHEPERTSEHWKPIEALVVSGGYRFTYCDGLNRFYIANEKYDALSKAFEVPPNIYDNWIRAEERNLQLRCDAAEGRIREARNELQATQEYVRALELRIAGVDERYRMGHLN